MCEFHQVQVSSCALSAQQACRGTQKTAGRSPSVGGPEVMKHAAQRQCKLFLFSAVNDSAHPRRQRAAMAKCGHGQPPGQSPSAGFERYTRATTAGAQREHAGRGPYIKVRSLAALDGHQIEKGRDRIGPVAPVW